MTLGRESSRAESQVIRGGGKLPNQFNKRGDHTKKGRRLYLSKGNRRKSTSLGGPGNTGIGVAAPIIDTRTMGSQPQLNPRN